MKTLFLLLAGFLYLQSAAAQDSKLKAAQQKVVVADEYDYYVDVLNTVDGVCINWVSGLAEFELPHTVCAWEPAFGGYDTPATLLKVQVGASEAYDIVLYVNEYEWDRRSAPQTYMEHVFNVSVFGGANFIISIEPYTGDM